MTNSTDEPQRTSQTPQLRWQSAYGWPRPSTVHDIDQHTTAEQAYQWASQGQAMLWHGDYHGARQLLSALRRRIEKRPLITQDIPWPERFHRVRQWRAQTARMTGSILLQVNAGYVLPYRRAPDVTAACQSAYGSELSATAFLLPLTELMGVQSAYEWQQRGLWISQLNASIYPRWGVFAPTRHEYLELVMQAKLAPDLRFAADIGTGTGVLACLLCRRNIDHVVATESAEAAWRCARENIARLGLQDRVELQRTDSMPMGRFDLLVCNPPWLPGAVRHPLDAAVYDPENRMLRMFLRESRAHLTPNGRSWLILSDLAEHLQLRTREALLAWIDQAGLTIKDRIDIRATHRKSLDTSDPLHEARSREITSLWVLSSSDEKPE
jgi:hypothetical protein